MQQSCDLRDPSVYQPTPAARRRFGDNARTMDAIRRSTLRCIGAGAAAGLGAGCAGIVSSPGPATASAMPEAPAADAATLAARMAARLPLPGAFDALLLGEVHDHALQHAARADWLRRAAGHGRFALAVEQLDADRQPAVDEARAGGGSPRALAEAAGFSFAGWEWTLYEPYLALALERGLPLVAANLSAADTMAIARGRDHPLIRAEPEGWGEAEREAMAAEIRDGHCGLLPQARVPAMAAAQRARDAQMARALEQAALRHRMPVVLLAGNGHVRRDLGVPRHLAGRSGFSRTVAVGLLEGEPGARAAAYDIAFGCIAQPRPDPCEGLRTRLAPPR